MDLINEIEDNDDFDEDIVEFIHLLDFPRRPRVIRERPDHFDMWDEHDFYVRIRNGKNSANIILGQIEDSIGHKTNWNNALSPSNMLLLTLKYYATGSMLLTVGDFAGVSKSTASVVVTKVSHAIALLREQYIQMPTTERDIGQIKQRFYRMARFPRVIGALDCTHVKILSPGGENAEVYRNRKGFFSISVQTVCDAKLKVIDIVARWPGSAHYSNIFNNSVLRGRFEHGLMVDNLLVADSGYENRNYILTPLATTNTPAEALYNESLIRTRNCVERSYGVWKRRFSVLSAGFRLHINKIQSIIVATAILHNIACMNNKVHLPPLEPALEAAVDFVLNMPNEDLREHGMQRNNLTRNHLIHNYFQQLV